MFVAQVFTGMEGIFTPVDETVERGLRISQILHDLEVEEADQGRADEE